MTLPKEFRKIALQAKDKGWTWTHSANHIVFNGPNGRGRVVVAVSASDKRALKNTITYFRRQGLDLKRVS